MGYSGGHQAWQTSHRVEVLIQVKHQHQKIGKCSNVAVRMLPKGIFMTRQSTKKSAIQPGSTHVSRHISIPAKKFSTPFPLSYHTKHTTPNFPSGTPPHLNQELHSFHMSFEGCQSKWCSSLTGKKINLQRRTPVVP